MAVKLTAEQKERFNKLTVLQQEICLNKLAGMNDIDSYKASSGKAKTVATMEASVSEILSKPKVSEFLRIVNDSTLSNAIMSRQETLERLSVMARTNMSDLIEWQQEAVKGDDGETVMQSLWRMKESSELNQGQLASIAEVTAGRDGFKIKQHSPLQAMKMISDLQGYEVPKKTELSGSITTVTMNKDEYAEVRKQMLADDDC